MLCKFALTLDLVYCVLLVEFVCRGSARVFQHITQSLSFPEHCVYVAFFFHHLEHTVGFGVVRRKCKFYWILLILLYFIITVSSFNTSTLCNWEFGTVFSINSLDGVVWGIHFLWTPFVGGSGHFIIKLGCRRMWGLCVFKGAYFCNFYLPRLSWTEVHVSVWSWLFSVYCVVFFYIACPSDFWVQLVSISYSSES